jgi:hypothetical protein
MSQVVVDWFFASEKESYVCQNSNPGQTGEYPNSARIKKENFPSKESSVVREDALLYLTWFWTKKQ